MNSGISPEEWFHDLGTKYAAAQIYFHLNQAGVFRHLAQRGSADAASAAKALHLNQKALACLLEYLHHVDGLLLCDREGRYRFSPFGRAVIKRYDFNFLDVRVGAYGPVWSGLGTILKGGAVRRAGGYARDGLMKSSVGFMPVLRELLGRAGTRAAVEFGADTGLISRIAEEFPGLACYAVDKDKAAGAITSDLFDVENWARKVKEREGVLFFSIHFHEFLAQGEPAVRGLLRDLRKRFPGSRLAVLEQPRLPKSREARLPRSQWLYSQSNVLIHHLAGNGRILSREGWSRLLGAGVKIRPVGYLGYDLFLVRL